MTGKGANMLTAATQRSASGSVDLGSASSAATIARLASSARSMWQCSQSSSAEEERSIRETREDGSQFLVLLERGLDFIAFDTRGRGAGDDAGSYVVVKEE